MVKYKISEIRDFAILIKPVFHKLPVGSKLAR